MSSSHTHHEKKTPRPISQRPTAPGKSPITTPPRVALGRNKIDHGDTASIKSVATIDSTHTNGSPTTDLDLTVCKCGDCRNCDKKKIESLEKELEVMASEFEKELTQLSVRLTNERESSQFYQQKHTSLHQTYLSTDTSLRLLRSELSSLTTTTKDREKDFKTRISSLALDRDAFREAYDEAMSEMREKEEMVGTLRSQVWGLKSWVSKGGRGGEEQVSDEGVGEGWGKLGNGLQNWVIVNFRRVKVDVEKASPKTKETLSYLLPNYEPLASSSKVHFIQSLVSRLLVDTIFSSYFIGIPQAQAEELERIEKYLSDFGPEESINQWRSSTLSLLRKDTSKLQTHTEVLTMHLITTLNDLLHSITDAQPSEPRDATLRTLIASSIDLSRLLRAQKAVFTVETPILEPHQQTLFDLETMEDVGGEDEDGLEQREVGCIVFPGITKRGDENGERGYLRNVVCKIKVLCAPD